MILGGAEFREQARAFLERDERRNNLILGLADRLAADPTQGTGFLVRDEHGVRAAATLSSERGLVLAGCAAESLAQLAEELHRREFSVPAANGPVAAVDAFTSRWCELSNCHSTVRMELRAHVLDRVTATDPVQGVFRRAAESDLQLALQWTRAFRDEADVYRTPDAVAASRVNALDEGRLYLWETDRPVSMAAWSRPTRTGVSINGVYTAPSQRGKGFATSLVAALSQRMLDEGRAFCTLFTDRANPTSNRIYARIGYRPVEDFRHVLFEPA